MTQTEWMGLAGGLGLAAAVAAAARAGLAGGGLRHEQSCRLVCPRFGEPVLCTMEQDVRTGQWKEVRACSAFPEPEKLLCERDCARLMNLGFRLDGAVRA